MAATAKARSPIVERRVAGMAVKMSVGVVAWYIGDLSHVG